LIFADDFEDGDYDGWTDAGGWGTKEVTETTAAAATRHSYHEFDSSPGHFDGLYQVLGLVQPKYIGFHIRSGSATSADAYAVFRNSSGLEVIWFLADSNGRLYVNGDQSYPYAAETWYHIEFKNVDFNSKTFDYYVNGELIRSGISFRNASSVKDLYRLDICNYTYSSQAWWDEIWIGRHEPVRWFSAHPSSDTVAAGSSANIEIIFDAAGLETEDYHADVCISSNDRDEPEIVVPVHLAVVEGALSPFSLLLPPNKAFTPHLVHFDWEDAVVVDSLGEVTYDLYVSTSAGFPADSTVIDGGLDTSEHWMTLDYGSHYWKVRAEDGFVSGRWSNQVRRFIVTGFQPGDVNRDDQVNVGDAVFLINYLYRSGEAPDPIELGWVNCDQVIDIGDVVYLINYLFKGGSPPGC
jgi:hypothetical protein